MAGLRLEAQIGADASGFNAVMGGLGKSVGGVASSIKSQLAAAFSIGAISALTKATIDLGGRLSDVADNLNINVVLLQKLNNAAMIAGGSLEDIEKFGFELNKSRGEAVSKPGGIEAKAFGRLGFSPAEIANSTAEEFITKMAARIAQGVDAQGSNDFIEVGGRAAKKILLGLSAGLENNIGGIMSEDVVNQLDEIGDLFSIVGNRMKVELAPALLGISRAVGLAILALKIAIMEAYAIGTETFKGSKHGVPGAFVGLVKGSMQAQKNREMLIEEYQSDQEAIAKMAETRAEAREQRRKSGPGFALATDTQPAVKTAQQQIVNGIKPYSDSLLAVGNFLGAGRGAISSVAQKQLEVARQQFDVQKQILNKLSDSGGINVPGI